MSSYWWRRREERQHPRPPAAPKDPVRDADLTALRAQLDAMRAAKRATDAKVDAELIRLQHGRKR